MHETIFPIAIIFEIQHRIVLTVLIYIIIYIHLN